ncbi:hypothetical protein [Jiella sp. M17.18]|uniref:hypothetical protein n=1 Tax=Jiella sp. M17.18 TaxID=3234247 RepID=UPI0034DFD664
MPRRLDVEIAETRRFQLDCALYGLSEAAKLRALVQMESDPAIGRSRADKPSLWEWELGEFSITYALAGEMNKIVLLELRPRVEKPTQLLKRTWEAIDRINALKRLFGL